jgi:uncharacterized protein (DUF2062 family)
MVISRVRLHSIPVFMSTHELVKTVFGKESRSGFHNFLTAKLPASRAPEAGFDVLGTILVVGLLMGMVLMMRLILTN